MFTGDYAMPAFNFLGEDELHKILNYVRTTLGNELDPISIKSIKEAQK